MQIESLNLKSVEEELHSKILHFESFSKQILGNEVYQQTFQDMVLVLKSLYNTILHIKNSHFLSSHFNNSDYSLLSLSNISPDFLSNLQLLSLKLHIPCSQILNALMTEILSHNSDNSSSKALSISHQRLKKNFSRIPLDIVLSHKDYLEVIGSDLSDSDIKYSFHEIDILIFKDIPSEEFIYSIGSISNCKVVFIPKFIPKLLIYSKIKHVESINLYDSLDDVYDTIFIFK